MASRFKHIFNVALIAAAILVSFKGCKHHQDTTTDQAMSPVLKDDERDKITINLKTGRAEQTTRRAPNAVGKANNSPTTSRNLDGARKLAITVKDDGRIEVYAQRSGFILEPGVGLVYEEKTRLSLDAQIFFFRRYCVGTGISFTKQGRPRVFVDAAYNIWHNSYILLGVDNKKEIVMGFRVAL